ncbi:MAG: MmcB family DNA repair protein [Pseudomonadota bacterium]|nr:MmcB family DNA repair protein [Pseudomonadota bacterium]
MLADGFGASVIREPPEGTFNAARRKALMLRFARTSAARLHKYIDPEWIRG